MLNICKVRFVSVLTTCIGENHTTKFLKSLELTITLNSSTNLLGSWSNGADTISIGRLSGLGRNLQQRLGLDSVVESILSDGSCLRLS